MKDFKKFVGKLLILALPIILQQLFINLASLIDNLMVGQLDDIQVSGVYVATQIVFIVNLMLFGSIEGGSVFFCQFYGVKDEKNMRKVVYFKLLFSLTVASLATVIVGIFQEDLIRLFISDSREIEVAKTYLSIVLFSIIPFALSNVIASTYREIHKSLPPMLITLLGTFVNIFFNYLFIFGNLNFPRMQGGGAAIGTLLNRLFEVVLLILLILFTKDKLVKNIFKIPSFDKVLFKNVLIKSIPLFINELLWSLSQITLVYTFTKCNPIATSVLPIVQTIFNLLFVALLGLGHAITIMVGNVIGEGDFKKGQSQAYYSLITTLLISSFLGVILFILAPFIVSLYKGIGKESLDLAIIFIRYMGFYIVINAINTSLFFLLRAGGRTGVVFFFDSFYGWIISIPIAFLLLTFTNLELVYFYPLVYSLDLIKTVLGFVLLFSRKWYRRVIA